MGKFCKSFWPSDVSMVPLWQRSGECKPFHSVAAIASSLSHARVPLATMTTINQASDPQQQQQAAKEICKKKVSHNLFSNSAQYIPPVFVPAK